MTDFDKVIDLCKKNNYNYRIITAYDENNECYPCIWLDTGHIEFSKEGNITNVVNY